MELTVQIGFNELVQAIKKLPPEQRQSLREILQAEEQITSASEASNERKFGAMAGLIVYMADDFDAPLDDFADYT